MENNNPETKIYSAGYAGTFHGSSDISTEYSCFYEKEPDGTVGASNLYILASGIKGTSAPEVSGRFTAKKLLYEYFHSYDYVVPYLARFRRSTTLLQFRLSASFHALCHSRLYR